MIFKIMNNKEDLAKNLAIEFLNDISKQDVHIGLPGGSTPIGMYNLIEPIVKNNSALNKVNYYSLDEVSSSDGSISSNESFLNEYFFDRNNIPNHQKHILNEQTIHDYRKKLEEINYSFDTVYLGVGLDGHIAGITPGTPLSEDLYIGKNTPHFIELLEKTFGGVDNVPENVATVGLLTLMKSKKIIVMLQGSNKQEIVKKAFFGEVTTEVPASILQLHPNVTVYLDEDAASLIHN